MMNGKRFKIRYGTISTNYPSGKIFDNKKQHSLYLDEVVDLLNEQQATIIKQDEEIKRLEKMIWKIQWRFQQEVGIEKAKEDYQEIDKEMED